MAISPAPREITRELAAYAAGSRFETLPERIRTEAARGFLNWVGCALGGCREDAVRKSVAVLVDHGGGPHATIIGAGKRTDVANAAFVNCISSSIQAYDDAHLSTVTHPTGPVGAALLAVSERCALAGRPVSGEDFLSAFALGVEVTCRLSTMLLLPPATFNVGFYVTGLTAPIGVALAVGRLLGLDAQRLNWAIGLAASQSSGFRATHGTMTAHFRPGHATRAGVFAALLAEQGFDSAEDALESDKGFADVFAAGADLSRATERLGAHFELLQNAYKPYPCGIVIHPTIDACLDIRSRLPQNARFSRVVLRVHPLVLKLTDVRTPRTPLESHISVYHWAAVALLHGKAGLPETQQPCIDDPIVAALRASIEVVADATVDRGAAHVTVDLEGKPPPQAVVKAARGSVERPMTDGELDEKFLSQATMVLSRDRSHRLLAACRSIRSCPDVGGAIGALLTS